MVIDIHCHAGTAEKLQAPWTTRADLSAYLERAEEAGIDKTVVFAITSDDYERANLEIAEIVSHSPDKRKRSKALGNLRWESYPKP